MHDCTLLLHAGIHIIMDETNKKLSMRPQYGIVGEGSKGRVDYAIKYENQDFGIFKKHFRELRFLSYVNLSLTMNYEQKEDDRTQKYI
jgi:hypothetical protein